MSKELVDNDFSIDKFIKQYSMYKRLAKDDLFVELFSEMTKPENLLAMTEACNKDRPALEGILSVVDNEYFDKLFDDSRPDRDYIKKAVGAVAYFLIEPFGYRKTNQGRLGKSKNFRTGMCYRLGEEKPRYKLVKTVKLEKTED